MCIGRKTPKAPTPAAPLPEAAVAPEPPKPGEAPGQAKRADKKRKAGSGTLLTGPRGLTDKATTESNTLLGG